MSRKILDPDSPWFWIAGAVIAAIVVVVACTVCDSGESDEVDDTTLMLITVPQ
jgi:hypothetical protein